LTPSKYNHEKELWVSSDEKMVGPPGTVFTAFGKSLGSFAVVDKHSFLKAKRELTRLNGLIFKMRSNERQYHMTARLENWRVIENDDGTYRLIGQIYNDERTKLKDGVNVLTSPLLKIDFLATQAFTKNTTYELGKHLYELNGSPEEIFERRTKRLLKTDEGPEVSA